MNGAFGTQLRLEPKFTLFGCDRFLCPWQAQIKVASIPDDPPQPHNNILPRLPRIYAREFQSSARIFQVINFIHFA